MNLNLIDDVKEIIKKNTEEINKTGKGFNLLSILGMENNERYTHSNIIAELLNAKGSHTFGNTFFKLFLEELNISDFNISNYEVITEEFVGVQLGIRTFLDIVIKDKTTGKVILIENKIWADDQPFQIERYYEAYKGNILKLFYLNVNEWNECPTEREEIQLVFENISYKKHIKNWLANCIVASSQKPYINKQIEVYYETILKLSNQNIYKKMSIEIENKMTENYENFQTAEEIANRFNNMKVEKINYLFSKLKEGFIKKRLKYEDKNLFVQIAHEGTDFFLGFWLQDNLNNPEINFNDDQLISKLKPIFDNNMNSNWLGWVAIDTRKDVFYICKDVDSFLKDTILKFDEAIRQVESILGIEFSEN
ncbi:MAG: PD-(D/E)XK nuclease family protein [Algoriella sp.]